MNKKSELIRINYDTANQQFDNFEDVLMRLSAFDPVLKKKIDSLLQNMNRKQKLMKLTAS
jgi:hypothetical protein